MLPLVLYVPLAVALAVLLFYSAREAVRGYGHGRLEPLALGVAATLFSSLYLMFGADQPWAAVGVAAVVAGPLLAPAALIVVAVLIGWVTGKPIRWN
mgnify:CR=1 FL=1